MSQDFCDLVSLLDGTVEDTDICADAVTDHHREEIRSTASSETSVSNVCPICLCSIKKRAVLDNCIHSFCFDCIHEWGTHFCNNCPFCKTPFNSISYIEHTETCLNTPSSPRIVKSKYTTAREFATVSREMRLRPRGCTCAIHETPIATRTLPATDPSFDAIADLIVCLRCGSGANEDLLLLCDSCDAGHHTYCLEPPLAEVPAGQWFCPACAAQSRSAPSVPSAGPRAQARPGTRTRPSSARRSRPSRSSNTRAGTPAVSVASHRRATRAASGRSGTARESNSNSDNSVSSSDGDEYSDEDKDESKRGIACPSQRASRQARQRAASTNLSHRGSGSDATTRRGITSQGPSRGVEREDDLERGVRSVLRAMEALTVAYGNHSLQLLGQHGVNVQSRGLGEAAAGLSGSTGVMTRGRTRASLQSVRAILGDDAMEDGAKALRSGVETLGSGSRGIQRRKAWFLYGEDEDVEVSTVEACERQGDGEEYAGMGVGVIDEDTADEDTVDEDCENAAQGSARMGYVERTQREAPQATEGERVGGVDSEHGDADPASERSLSQRSASSRGGGYVSDASHPRDAWCGVPAARAGGDAVCVGWQGNHGEYPHAAECLGPDVSHISHVLPLPPASAQSGCGYSASSYAFDYEPVSVWRRDTSERRRRSDGHPVEYRGGGRAGGHLSGLGDGYEDGHGTLYGNTWRRSHAPIPLLDVTASTDADADTYAAAENALQLDMYDKVQREAPGNVGAKVATAAEEVEEVDAEEVLRELQRWRMYALARRFNAQGNTYGAYGARARLSRRLPPPVRMVVHARAGNAAVEEAVQVGVQVADVVDVDVEHVGVCGGRVSGTAGEQGRSAADSGPDSKDWRARLRDAREENVRTGAMGKGVERADSNARTGKSWGTRGVVSGAYVDAMEASASDGEAETETESEGEAAGVGVEATEHGSESETEYEDIAGAAYDADRGPEEGEGDGVGVDHGQEYHEGHADDDGAAESDELSAEEVVEDATEGGCVDLMGYSYDADSATDSHVYSRVEGHGGSGSDTETDAETDAPARGVGDCPLEHGKPRVSGNGEDTMDDGASEDEDDDEGEDESENEGEDEVEEKVAGMAVTARRRAPSLNYNVDVKAQGDRSNECLSKQKWSRRARGLRSRVIPPRYVYASGGDDSDSDDSVDRRETKRRRSLRLRNSVRQNYASLF